MAGFCGIFAKTQSERPDAITGCFLGLLNLDKRPRTKSTSAHRRSGFRGRDMPVRNRNLTSDRLLVDFYNTASVLGLAG